jgi:hypothetical protein
VLLKNNDSPPPVCRALLETCTADRHVFMQKEAGGSVVILKIYDIIGREVAT